MEKPFQPKSAHQAQSHARATASTRPRSLTGGPRLSAPTRAPLLSLYPSRCFVGPSTPFLFARARALSLCLVDPTRQPSLTSRPCSRVHRPPPHALAPLELVPHSPTSPCSLAPSAELSRHVSRLARAADYFAAAYRSSSPVSRPSLSPRRTRFLGKLRRITRSVRSAKSNPGRCSLIRWPRHPVPICV